MEIALFLVRAFVAYIYFDAEKQHNLLHRIFSMHHAKLEGNSIGILNVQKWIKLLRGREYGLTIDVRKAHSFRGEMDSTKNKILIDWECKGIIVL